METQLLYKDRGARRIDTTSWRVSSHKAHLHLVVINDADSFGFMSPKFDNDFCLCLNSKGNDILLWVLIVLGGKETINFLLLRIITRTPLMCLFSTDLPAYFSLDSKSTIFFNGCKLQQINPCACEPTFTNNIKGDICPEVTLRVGCNNSCSVVLLRTLLRVLNLKPFRLKQIAR